MSQTVAVLIVVVVGVATFVLLHLRPLSTNELERLAQGRRVKAVKRYFIFGEHHFIIPPELKSGMRRDGQFLRVSYPLRDFPGIAAGFLKSKKHEWILFGFERYGTIELIWFNKGFDNSTVSPLVSVDEILAVCCQEGATSVLCVHNHPDGSLRDPSQADFSSAQNLTAHLFPIGVNLLEFICAAGWYKEYVRYIADQFMPILGFRDYLKHQNGVSKWGNWKLHLERLR